MTPTFVGTSDYHLVKNDAANLACCVDKITPTASAATTSTWGINPSAVVGHRRARSAVIGSCIAEDA